MKKERKYNNYFFLQYLVATLISVFEYDENGLIGGNGLIFENCLIGENGLIDENGLIGGKGLKMREPWTRFKYYNNLLHLLQLQRLLLFFNFNLIKFIIL